MTRINDNRRSLLLKITILSAIKLRKEIRITVISIKVTTNHQCGEQHYNYSQSVLKKRIPLLKLK